MTTEERMYCEIYSCHMAVAVCIARQENARKYIESKAWGPGRVKPGALDVNCQNCKQGKEIMEKYKEDEHRTSNVQRPMVNEKNEAENKDLPGPNGKEELEMRICSRADCEFAGQPQPIGNFQIHGRSKSSGARIGTCKSCMTRKRLAGTKRNKLNKKPAVVPGETLQTGTKLPPVPRDPITYQYYPPDMLGTLMDGLPEVLKAIEETAHEQERTPIAQVRYLLKTDYRITGTDAENERY